MDNSVTEVGYLQFMLLSEVEIFQDEFCV